MKDESVGVFYSKLSDVETKLKTGKIPFLRVHQSYLVNYHLIRSKSKTDITLINGKILSISEGRQKNFNCEYTRLLGGEISG